MIEERSISIVKQPDGLYACFSANLGTFVHYGFTRDELVDLCINAYTMSKRTAERVLGEADSNESLWTEAMDKIGELYGEESANNTRRVILGG